MVRRRKAGAPTDDGDRPAPDGALFRLMRGPARFGARVAARFGADRGAAEAILITRLRIDARTGGLKQPNKPQGTGMLATCLVYLLFGAMSGLAMLVAERSDLAAGLVQGLLLLLLSMLLVTDYVLILLDPAEADVVASRPVPGRTLFLARLVHLVLYLVPPVTAFCVAPTLFAAFGPGGWRLALLVPVLSALTAATAVATVLLAFLLCVRTLDSERLSNVLLRVQIGSNLVFAFLFIGVNGLVLSPTVRGWIESDHWTHALVPPFWSAGLTALVLGADAPLSGPLAALAVLAPAALLLGVVRLAGDRFVTGVAALRVQARGEAPRRAGRIRRLAARLVSPGAERAGFDAFFGVSVRERGFRTRVYPMMALPFAMVLWTAFDPSRHARMDPFVWGSVIPMFYAVIIVMQVRYSDTPAAAWVFAATPLADHGRFLAGVVKAALLAFVLPWIALVMLVAALVTEDGSAFDVVFGVECALLVALVSARSTLREAFPFSREFTPRQSGQQAVMWAVLLASGVAWLVLSALRRVPFGVPAGSVLLVPLIMRRLRALGRIVVDPRTIPIPK